MGLSIQDVLNLNNQAIGNDLFSQVTGEIQKGLKNSGVELNSQVVPIAKNDKKESLSNIAMGPLDTNKMLFIGAVLIAGFFLYKKVLKKRV